MADKLELDAITGEIVTRNFNKTEAAQRAKDLAKYAAQSIVETERAAAKQAVLNKLGLTADEVAALLS